MAGRKFPKEDNRHPGTSQLGHSPFGKEKLEGPKKHHDDHGPYDSGPSENMKVVKGSDFNPKCSDERKTTYIKVNKEDH
jgi:hypothetical protein